MVGLDFIYQFNNISHPHQAHLCQASPAGDDARTAEDMLVAAAAAAACIVAATSSATAAKDIMG